MPSTALLLWLLMSLSPFPRAWLTRRTSSLHPLSFTNGASPFVLLASEPLARGVYGYRWRHHGLCLDGERVQRLV
ncbi:hypothetical protein P691DRAFT_812751 [Macrolepiota fuliginosa MF-IS2]|uniref:Secreted protein n=1 Tax=Macrolepiota fuliginosa MF-IS2 TaxID=1400762 RepID=A0A9P6C5J9_9AGAR|nr:hypothetical protein P691DRAFT_812751 [Macrolepiota fuliginosa MF-IS2]